MANVTTMKDKQGSTYTIYDTRFGSASVPKINGSPVATQADIASSMVYKGHVSQASDLPNSPSNGDTYISDGTFALGTDSVTPGDMIIWNNADNKWDVIDLNQSGNITGSGTSTQFAYFTGAAQISGATGITYTAGTSTLTAPHFSGDGASLTGITYASSAGTASKASALDVASAIGSAAQPVYVKADGTISAISYTIEKSVPSNANFDSYSTATSSTFGLVKIGYTTTGTNYAVQLSNGQMFVSVPWTNTTYTAGTGLSFSGSVINHKNSVTASTAGTSATTSGSTLQVPFITYDAQGHISATGTHTHNITGFATSDTTNTAGTVADATSRYFFPVGYTSTTSTIGSGINYAVTNTRPATFYLKGGDTYINGGLTVQGHKIYFSSTSSFSGEIGDILFLI